MDESLWITQKAMAELFGVQVPAYQQTPEKIFEEGELDEKVVASKMEITSPHGAIPGKTQSGEAMFYNLDAIISVGYRVNSKKATRFRAISRDILVPADMPLHNLHYAIQKAFGWQNSHLHHFTYEDELLENLFGGKFISWVPFCGLYFRFPSENFDDLYWDDDYEEGYSVKSWLRSKYTGPYYYGGNSELYLAAQLAARFFLQENRTVKVGPSFDEYRKGKKGTTSHKIEDVSMDAMKMYFAAGMDELLERIPVG